MENSLWVPAPPWLWVININPAAFLTTRSNENRGQDLEYLIASCFGHVKFAKPWF